MQWTCHIAFISCLQVRGGFGGLLVFHNDTNQASDQASRGTSNPLTSYSQFLIFLLTLTAERTTHQQIMVKQLFIDIYKHTYTLSTIIVQLCSVVYEFIWMIQI